MKRIVLPLGCAFLLAACEQGGIDEQTEEGPAETTTMEEAESDTTMMVPGGAASADVRDAEGNSIGRVELRETDGGVALAGMLAGLSPGEHGFHIHETGLCEPPAFESAGGHFAPGGRQHGFDHPEGPHAGDLWNLEVAQDSTVTVSATDSLVTLREGANALLGGDGSALVIHLDPDDYRSQPSGASGDRVACGVIEG
ncbi:MAG: superoxide dismutase family protein [Gemmatimonadota bacterium]